MTIVSGMPTKPARPNAHTHPMSTVMSGSRRHRTSKSTRRMTTMIATAIPVSVSIPPRR